MEITKDTLLKDILAEYPWLSDELKKKWPAYKVLDGLLGRMFLRNATIEDLAKKADRTPEHLIMRLEETIEEHEGQNGGQEA